MSSKVGEIITFERTFTEKDVELFTKISGDEGAHHITPDAQGRFILQGLLTATVPTKIVGDHNVLARKTSFEFFRPVFTGDTISCEFKIEEYDRQENNRISFAASFLCKNQDEKNVLAGDVSGIIL